VTPELIAHLKHFEGWRANPYRDQAGIPTIGYGHQIESMDHTPLTLEEGEQLLLEDIQHHEAIVLRLSPGLATDSPRRLDAIVDFVFNIGGNKYSKSTLRRRVRAKDWPAAAVENDKWVYITLPSGQQVKSEWQISRRAATSAWLRDG